MDVKSISRPISLHCQKYGLLFVMLWFSNTALPLLAFQGFVNIFMREPDPSLRYKEIPVLTVKASPRGGGPGGKGGDGSGAAQTPSSKGAKAKKK